MKKKLVIALIVVVAIIVGVVGSQYAMHAKGNQCVQNGQFEQAAEYYAKDLLFSAGLPEEAMKMAGYDYLEKGEYKETIRVFEGLGGFEDEICRANCGIAHSKATTHPEEALEILDGLNPSAATQAEVDSIRLEIAQFYLGNNMYDEALSVARDITDPSLEGVQEVKNEVFFTKGLEAVQSMFAAQVRDTDTTHAHCRKIADLMGNCVDDPRSAMYLDVLNPLLEERFEDAVNKVFPLVEEFSQYGTLEQWHEIFNELLPDEKFTDWEDQLANQQRILAMFGKRASSVTDSLMQETVTAVVDAKKTAFYDVYPSDIRVLPYETVEGVLKEMGSNPNGKILILKEFWDQQDNTKSDSKLRQRKLMVCGELMNRLPEELYPTSAADVEYVIVLSYDYTVTGTYMGMGRVISGYQEKGTVKAYSLPGVKTVYNSGTQYGTKLGSNVKMSDNRVLTGGRPYMGSCVMTALETIASKMN